MRTGSKILESATIKLLILLSVGIFTGEAVVARFLPHLLTAAGWLGGMADASFLTLVTFLLLYFFIFRPLIHLDAVLRESEERFRNTFDQAAVGMAHVAIDGYFLRLNDRWCDIVGYSREELMTMSFQDLTHPDDLQASVMQLRLFQRGEGRAFATEKKYLRKDKSIVWVNLTVSYVSNPNGVKNYFIAVIEDVTERKRADAALRESENNLNVILESTADGILAVDGKGKVLRTNKRFAELWSIPQSLVDSKDDDALLNHVLGQLTEPEAFLSKVRLLYRSADEDRDTLLFKDGRTFERYSAPVVMGGETLGRVWSFRDVTKQKSAEQQIADALNYSQTIFEASTIGIIVFAESGEAISANRAAAMIMGTTVENLGKQNFRELQSWKQSGLRGIAIEALASGNAKDAEIHHLSTFDKSVWLSARFVPFMHKGQKELLALFSDTTERKRAEEALRESEERYRSIIHASPDNITIADMEGHILMVSPIAVQMFGFAREEEARGLPITAFIVPEDRGRALSNIALKRHGVVQRSNEYRGLRKDGSTFDIEVNSDFIWDSNGQPKKIVLIARDITNRKQTERALRESDMKFRALYESSRDALMTLNPPSWLFTSCNQSTVEMFRAKNIEEFLSYGPAKVSPERQPDGRLSMEKAEEMIDIAMREGSNYFEWTHKRVDGEEFPATVLLTQIDVGGNQFLQATVRDITERKKAEEALVKSKRQYDNLVSNIPVGIYLLHRSYDGSMSFTYVSPRMADMLGLNAESILANPRIAFKTIHRDDLEILIGLNQERIQKPQPFDWEGRILCKGQSSGYTSSPDLNCLTMGMLYGTASSLTSQSVNKRRFCSHKTENVSAQYLKAPTSGSRSAI